MSCRHEEPLSFRSLYAGSVVSVREYCCRAGRGGPACEEYSNGNDIVLMRRGAFAKHFGRRTVTADVNQAVFFSKGATYRVSHPADRGDRGAVFTVESQALNAIVRELDPAIDEHPERPFPFVTSPCDSTICWRRHELIERLQASGGEAFSASRCGPRLHTSRRWPTEGKYQTSILSLVAELSNAIANREPALVAG